jgi:hypothetical protein
VKKKMKKGIGKFSRQGLAIASNPHLCGVQGEVGFALPHYFLLSKRRDRSGWWEWRRIMAALETLELR